MNYFALISFVAALGSFFLSFFVYARDPKNRLHQMFLFFGFSVTYLGITELGFRLAITPSVVYFWSKAAVLSPFATALFYHFVLCYTQRQRLQRLPFLLGIAYIPALVLSIIVESLPKTTTVLGLYLGQSDQFTKIPWIVADGIWTSMLLLAVLFFSYEHIRACSDRTRRSQARFVAIGITVPIFLSVVTEILLPLFHHRVEEMTLLGFAIADAVFGFAIWRYQLFRISPVSAATRIVSTMTDALFLTDRNHIIQEVNGAAAILLGCAANQITGKPIDRWLKQADGGLQAISVLSDFTTTGSEKQDVPSILITSAAEKIPVSLAIAPLTDDNATVQGFVLIARDIRERQAAADAVERARQDLEIKVDERTAKLASVNERLIVELDERLMVQTALAQEKERLAVTLRSIGDGVIATDDESRVVFLNRIAEELTGWEDKLAVGKKLSEVFKIIDGATDALLPNPFDLIRSTNGTIELDSRTVLVARDGKRRSIADSGAPIRNDQGAMIGTVLVFRDITERQRLEEALRQTQKLESIGLLAGGIAHDFNNILTGIIGNLFLIKTTMQTHEESYRLVQKTESAAFRASRLTQQLLTFSRGGSPVKQVTAIERLIEESIGFILNGSNTDYTLEFTDHLLAVEVDRGQFDQVMSNLLLNAAESMPDGGTIGVSVENRSFFIKGIEHDPHEAARFPGLKPGHYVKISVRDTGLGIPSDTIDRIFDPFFTTKSQGRGMGLSIVYSIVKQHGGYVCADSQINKGTVFSVYLPAAVQVESSPQLAPAPSKSLESKVRILLMDDEPGIRDSVGELLHLVGFEVTTVRDGMEAIKAYSEALETDEPFDVVILDLTVPGGMGGEECMLHLIKIHHEVRAIVSSGYANSAVMAGYRAYGFKDVLTKPYRIEELIEKIKKVSA